MVDSLGIVLSRIIPVFEQLGITYFIGGSVASGAHGEKRQTNDVDIVVDMKPEQVAPLVGLLEKEFYVDEEMILSSLEHRSSFNFIHFETAYKVDLFPVKLRAYDRQVVERSQQHLVDSEPPIEAYTAEPEDIVLAKLEWYHSTNETSDRQWNDILGVLKLQSFTLDFDYMQRWASEIGVGDLLERALNDAGLKE